MYAFMSEKNNAPKKITNDNSVVFYLNIKNTNIL